MKTVSENAVVKTKVGKNSSILSRSLSTQLFSFSLHDLVIFLDENFFGNEKIIFFLEKSVAGRNFYDVADLAKNSNIFGFLQI